MCCFSGPVQDVAATRIFARMVSPGRQLLAYEMQFSAATPVAMILPIPTPPRSADDAIRFISLEHYPRLFEELVEPFAFPGGRSRSLAFGKSLPAPQLVVHTVGAFVASFVPTLADFDRLDPMFRLPAGTLDRVPAYADYGFVVFQLAATHGKTRVHPMAFEFPTREPGKLFYPTIHIHDGEVHAEALFDHSLYAQGTKDGRFEIADEPARSHMHDPSAKLVVDLDQHVARCLLRGTQRNRDHWVALAA